MKKSLSVAYGLSKRNQPGSKAVSEGAVKRAISPISDKKDDLVNAIMKKRKMAQGGKVELDNSDEIPSGEIFNELNEETNEDAYYDLEGQTEDTDVVSNEKGDEDEMEENSGDLVSRARKKIRK